MKKPTIDLVIFDCDGTLVDSEILCNLGLEIKLKELGIEVATESLMSKFRGWKLADIVDAISQEYSLKLDDAFIPSYRQLVSELFDKQLQPIPDVAFALAKISQPKCVASNAPLNKIEQAVKVTQLEHFFGHHLFSSYTIQAWKPKPDLFLHAAKMMGVNPQNCIVIEDSILGIEAAQSAGMRSFWYRPHNSHNSSYLDRGDTTFKSMLELPDLILASQRAK